LADLVDQLEQAIRAHCVGAMCDFSNADLAALDTRSLVADNAAWTARFPSVRPRSVYESDAMTASQLRVQYAEGLAAIRRDITGGVDLRRYLSSRARFAHGRDLLLAHAGIHHLHMSDVIGRWDRVERTDHVLFVAFQPDAAYLVDIYAHESDGANWAEQAILETILRNWPEAGILEQSRFATGLTQTFDDDMRAELRAAGVNLAIEVGGSVWSPAGATLTGAPIMAARLGMKVTAHLNDLRTIGASALEAQLAESVLEHAVSAEEWVSMVHDEHYGFYAERLDIFVRYGSLVAM
jgi:hypothetical protein